MPPCATRGVIFRLPRTTSFAQTPARSWQSVCVSDVAHSKRKTVEPQLTHEPDFHLLTPPSAANACSHSWHDAPLDCSLMISNGRPSWQRRSRSVTLLWDPGNGIQRRISSPLAKIPKTRHAGSSPAASPCRSFLDEHRPIRDRLRRRAHPSRGSQNSRSKARRAGESNEPGVPLTQV